MIRRRLRADGLHGEAPDVDPKLALATAQQPRPTAVPQIEQIWYDVRR